VTRKKLHIDELFRNGLRNLSLLVSSKDMEAIDDKKSVFSETPDVPKETAFSDFELEVSENDWLATKAKLDNEKSAMSQDNIFSKGFEHFAIEPEPEDWTETYRKYKLRKKRRAVYFWLGTGVVALLIALSVLFLSGSRDNAAPVAQMPPTTQNKTKSAELNNKNQETVVSELPSDGKTSDLNPDLTDGSLPNNIQKFSPRQPSRLRSEKGRRLFTAESQKIAETETVSAQIMSAESTTSLAQNTRAFADPVKAPEQAPEATVPPALIPDKISEPLSDLPLDKAQSTPSTDTPKQKPADKTLAPPPAKGIGLYAALINQMASAHRTLSAGNNSTYNQIRNAGERPTLLHTIGLEFGIQLNKNRFSSGLLSSTQTFSTQYKYNYKVYDSLPVWNPGRTQIIGYFLVRGRDTFINERNEVRIQKIQVPFEYSRIIDLSPKTSLIAGAGVLLAFNTGSSGSKMLNPANNYLYSYAALKDRERPYQVSPSLQFGLQQALYRKLKLEMLVYGNRGLYSRFNDEFRVKDYPYNIGINIKLLYQIK